jgi:aspartate/methionine/tyrosine aminotransferase
MTPSEDTLKALVNSALQSNVHGYQPYKGIPRLREGFARWYLDTYGVTLDPETEVLPMMGSKEGIMHISQAFLNPGDQVLIPNPGYPTYSSVTRLAGGEGIPYELTEAHGYQPDFEALEQLDLSRVKLMWVNYPHMPTGAAARTETFQRLIEFGKKHQILICHDNPYSLVLNRSPKSLLGLPGAKAVALELNSLSKSHNMAGWRVGMLAGREDYLQTVLRVKSNMDSGMFLPLQEAAATALENSYQWHHERNQEYARRRELIWEMFDTLGCKYERDQAGMFVWAKIPVFAESAEQFSDLILDQAQVFITPGFIFGSAGEGYIRASLCMPMEVIVEALKRIKALMAEGVKTD